MDLTMVRAQARVGTLLNGKWRLDKLVGVGGMAAVYAATHRNAKRVAIKILHPEISADDNARQRFLREGYAANQVGHRGAVSADDDGISEDGVAFLVLELLEGETIEERSVRHGGTLKAREVLALMDQALATLEAAHEKGIVHRDLKPENLFLTHEGVVKMLDFGIARMQDKASKSPSQTQGIMGTPSFMAPEQARGRWEEVDQRTDLWALGATMFTLFSGRFVHRAETANEALVAAVTQRAPSLATVVSNAHPAIVALIDKALAYERELRFQDATEFRAALQAADAVIAGDEASPSLRIPTTRATPVTQSGPLGLTTEGVAASVRGAQTNATVLAKQRSRATLALAGVATAALLVLVGRGLFAGAGKPSAFASEASTSAVPAAPTPAPRSDVSVSAAASAAAAASAPSLDPSATAAAPPSELAPAPPAVKAAAKLAHPGAAHSTGAAPLSAASAKAHAAKSTADLLKKRH